VSILNQTPSAFRQLIQVDQQAAQADPLAHAAHAADEARQKPLALPLALREVIFGGEALDLQSLRPWFAHHPDDQPRLVNMYGITETTVHVTYRPLTTADTAAGNGSLI